MKLGSEPAYPTPTERHNDGQVINWGTGGMSKREAFACAALQGLLASDTQDNLGPMAAANLSVLMADALLDELAK